MKIIESFFVCCLLTLCCACNESSVVKLSSSNQSDWNTQGKVTFDTSGMVLEGLGTQVFAKPTFKNFDLTMECKTNKGAIAAIMFHTGKEGKGYEVLVNNNPDPTEWRKTGSLSAVRNFGKRMADNNEWFPIRIEVKGKQVNVWVNNVWVTEYTEPDKAYREPEYAQRLLSEGLLSLVNKTDAPVSFRRIEVKRLPNEVVAESEAIDEQTDDIIRLQQQNFPTIDCHLHLKGGWTSEQAAAKSRKYGITYGIAPNCGKNFPITDDAGIQEWLKEMKNLPFLYPMQAEGREWVEMFSPEATSLFDYKFSDALTWTDHKGRRLRIWIPEETFVDNPDQFMDMLVDRACGIISNEPIDIFVNPTFLPESLMKDYDKLWTCTRMQRVIDAAVAHNVALEINCRFRIPSASFIKQAKQSGAKFSIGTNNAGIDDVGKIEYAIEMIKECGLTTKDMFIPTSKNI